ncbi:MAG: hypothetical protein GF390_03030 [Candidatus Pacebacteria bacterium]|nr:hypothetical protein [Candidatus Paceibacterota bacterium]
MTATFNSLGSNYDSEFVLLALKQLFWPAKKARQQLCVRLAKFFQTPASTVQLVYKGRDAIELALKIAGIGQGDQVLTQAFACYAVEEGIKRTQAQPVYVDLATQSLNPSIKTLNQALKRAPAAKAVIIQHTLGSVAEIKKIKAWCTKHNLILIEDLAQAMGGCSQADQQHPKPETLGLSADLIVLSFGRDKIIDAVTGGAVIVKAKKLQKQWQTRFGKASVPYLVGEGTRVKKLLYPLLTYLIRFSYDWQVGKLLHWLAKKFHLIDSPLVCQTQQAATLPQAFAQLALKQLARLSTQLEHRQKIAQYYYHHLSSLKHLQLITTQQDLQYGANLRFAIAVAAPQKLLAYLANHKLYVADRWYRSAVDCGQEQCQTVYKPGSCPQAEQLAQQIINLPTHQYVKMNTAAQIVQLLKSYGN